MDTFQFASGDGEVACLWGSGTDAIGVEACGKFLHVYGYAHLKLNAFGFEYPHAAVDYCFVEFEIRNTIAQ